MPEYLVTPTAPPTDGKKSCETLNIGRIFSSQFRYIGNYVVAEGWEYKDSSGGRYWKCTKGNGIAEESEIQEDSGGRGARQMTKGSMRRQRQGEQVGGCGCPSWLLLIFCKPLSASAISNHFLHLSLPFEYTHPPQHVNARTQNSDINLTHPPLSHLHPSPRPIYSPICWPVSFPLYLAASTFPWFPIPPLSTINTIFLFHLNIKKTVQRRLERPKRSLKHFC